MSEYLHCNMCDHCRYFGECASENEERVSCTFSNDDPYDDCAICVRQMCFEFFEDLPYCTKND